MKRSEMVKILAKELQIISQMSMEEDLPFETHLNDANCLLNKMEEQGMLPPHGLLGHGDFDECTLDHVEDCKWDREDV